jgi:hypothetical protein
VKILPGPSVEGALLAFSFEALGLADSPLVKNIKSMVYGTSAHKSENFEFRPELTPLIYRGPRKAEQRGACSHCPGTTLEQMVIRFLTPSPEP